METVRVEQVMRFSVAGSWLAKTRRGECIGLDTQLDVASSEPPERIRDWVRTAERACFTIQTLLHPVPARTDVTLNGDPLDLT